MNLEHPHLEPFEPVLRGLLGKAFTPPLLYPASAVRIATWAPDRQARRVVAEVIQEWREVQCAVGLHIPALQRDAQLVSDEIRSARRARDHAREQVLLAKRSVLQTRELLLRRLMDAIIYILCDQYVWFVRRLYRAGKPSADAATLARMVDLATRWTDPAEYRLCIAADLTTTVQIADIFEVTFETPVKKSIRLLEIKDGKVNRALKQYLEAELPDLESIRATMGEKAASQARRMLRQRERLRGLGDIVRDRKGVDPRTGKVMFRTADGPDSEGYQWNIRSAVEQAHERGQCIYRFDGCLILGAVRADVDADTSLPGVRHTFFHFRRKSRDCLLGTPRELEELSALAGEPPVFDFIAYHIGEKWDSPVFAWGNLDRVCDMLLGRMKIVAQFDMTQFAELAKAFGVRVKPMTKRAAKALGIGGRPRSELWWAVGAELPNGASIDLISGELQRVLLECARPKNVLKGIVEYAGEVLRIQKGTRGEPTSPSAE